MGMWSEIASQMGRDEVLRGLDRAQCEALIDALNLVAYADGQETLLERAELDMLIHELPLAQQSPDSVEGYRAESAKRMIDLARQGAHGLEEAAEQIGQRLEGLKLRKKALKMAAAVAYADFHAGDSEHATLAALARALGIPAPFAEEIIQEVKGESLGASFLDVETEPEIIPAVTARTVRDVLSHDFLEGFFSGLFAEDELQSLSEDGAMAFVDALTLALVADGYPELEELHEFKAQLEQLPFATQDATHVQARVEVVLNTLRTMDDAEIDSYIAGVAARIPSDSLKERALGMAIHITHADLHISDREQFTLARLAKGLGISPARLAELITQAKGVQGDDYFAD